MKKTSILLLIILLFSCQGSDWGEIRYTHSKTNVRTLKSASSKIVTTLQPNIKLKVVVSENDWWLVYLYYEKIQSRKTAIGYVHKSLLYTTPPVQKKVQASVKKSQEIKPPPPELKYTIVARQDASYSDTPRMVYRVVLNVDVIPDKILIEEVAEYLWDTPKKKIWLEFTVFFYLPNMNTNGFAYGIGEFTPSGKKSFEINNNSLSNTKWAELVKQGKSSSSTSTHTSKQKYKPKPTPEVSAWDGVAYCIKDYLKANLNDPKSLKIKDAYTVVPATDDFIQRVTYRAKNGFGALVLEDNVFFMKRVYGKNNDYEVYDVWSYSDFNLITGN